MYNGKILGWYWDYNWERWTVKRADWYDYNEGSSFDDNNMMYFVTITKTDSNYKIAHPLTKQDANLDNQLVAVETAENDNLVSPQFMLASQLGTVLTLMIGLLPKSIVLIMWRLIKIKQVRLLF